MVNRFLVALVILGLVSLASSATTYTGTGTNTVCTGNSRRLACRSTVWYRYACLPSSAPGGLVCCGCDSSGSCFACTSSSNCPSSASSDWTNQQCRSTSATSVSLIIGIVVPVVVIIIIIIIIVSCCMVAVKAATTASVGQNTNVVLGTPVIVTTTAVPVAATDTELQVVYDTTAYTAPPAQAYYPQSPEQPIYVQQGQQQPLYSVPPQDQGAGYEEPAR